jgi:hypothetical protein
MGPRAVPQHCPPPLLSSSPRKRGPTFSRSSVTRKVGSRFRGNDDLGGGPTSARPTSPVTPAKAQRTAWVREPCRSTPHHFFRHPRERGDPPSLVARRQRKVGSRFRGNDDLGGAPTPARPTSPVIPAKAQRTAWIRQPCRSTPHHYFPHPREGGDPPSLVARRQRKVGSRFRGNDDLGGAPPQLAASSPVIPAKAGTHPSSWRRHKRNGRFALPRE